jgi:hypothetical protein
MKSFKACLHSDLFVLGIKNTTKFPEDWPLTVVEKMKVGLLALLRVFIILISFFLLILEMVYRKQRNSLFCCKFRELFF